MKKLTIISIIIITLGGVGYYLYLTDSLNLDFLNKGSAVVEPVAVVESQQEVKEKIEDRIHPLCFAHEKITVKDCKHFFETDKVEKDKDGFYSAEQSIFSDDDMGPKGSIGYRIIGEKDNKVFAQVVDWNGGIGDGSTQSNIEAIEQVGDYYFTSKIAGGGYPCHDPVWRDSVKMKDNFIEYTQTNQRDVFGKEYFSGLKFSCFAVGEFRYDILKNKIELISAELLDPNQNDVYIIALEQDGDIEDACFRDVFLSNINQKKFTLNLKEIDEFKNSIKSCLNKTEAPKTPTSPNANTKTTTTYMCEGRVKIVRVQDSPSLPPRVSYLRTSDNVQVASYGDFGAYIRPEHFSIDRAQIEQGYSFNETNFCKYLKN